MLKLLLLGLVRTWPERLHKADYQVSYAGNRLPTAMSYFLQDAATAVRKRSAGDMEAAAFLASQEQPEEIAPATRAERDAEQLYQAELQRELQADLQASRCCAWELHCSTRTCS